MRVIDACAGAGGKSLHLAALMGNKGKVISMDVEEWKLQQAKLRARRNGVSIFEPKIIEGSKTIKRLKESADRLLLDVPDVAPEPVLIFLLLRFDQQQLRFLFVL